MPDPEPENAPDPRRRVVIVCEINTCDNCGAVVNVITCPTAEDVEATIVAHGQGGEDPIDHCEKCGILGTAYRGDEPEAVEALAGHGLRSILRRDVSPDAVAAWIRRLERATAAALAIDSSARVYVLTDDEGEGPGGMSVEICAVAPGQSCETLGLRGYANNPEAAVEEFRGAIARAGDRRQKDPHGRPADRRTPSLPRTGPGPSRRRFIRRAADR